MNVFISYPMEDGGWVKALRESLMEEGIDASSSDSIAMGEDLRKEIMKKLMDSDAVIVVVRKRPVSPWAMFEAGAAIAGNKIVFAITSEQEPVSPLPKTIKTIVADDPRRAAALIVEGLARPTR
jgi:hypothetical protein